MVGSAKLRKREHEKKKREQTWERKDGGALSLSSFFPPPLPEYKALNCPRFKKKKKRRTHRDPCPLLYPSTRSRPFIWAPAASAPEFYSVVLEKGYVQQVAYSRNMPEHHYSVNAA